MPITLNRDTRKAIIDVLSPFLDSTAAQQNLINMVFGDVPNLTGMINYGGAPRIFTGNLITVLHRYGEIDGRHTILLLLDEVEELAGDDVQAEIQRIKASLGDNTTAPPPAAVQPQTPPPQTPPPTGSSQTFNIGTVNAGVASFGGVVYINNGQVSETKPAIETPPAGTNLSPVERNQVFISYSHKETQWMKDLMTSLKPRMRYGGISVWNDELIKAGDPWREKIDNALAAARVAVLMVSRDFLASNFIMDKELPVILEAAKRDDVKIIWVPVTASAVKHTPIYAYQAAGTPLLSPSKTLDSLSESEKNQAIEKVADEIMDAYNT